MASGKSNLPDAIGFLRDVAKREGGGLQAAVARRVGYIRRRMRDLNQIALYENPVLVVADWDRLQDCAASRVSRLSGGLTAIAPNLLIRIAVLEIESWIMAYRAGIARWLRIAANTVPRNQESLADPKRTLVQLAANSRNRSLREAIAPAQGTGTHRTGLGYNDAVGEFVAQLWNPEAARRNAHSLDRAIVRIAELAILARPSPPPSSAGWGGGRPGPRRGGPLAWCAVRSEPGQGLRRFRH